MAGDIFYSQVNSSLKKELLLRGSAGKLLRSEKYMDWMTTRLSNVQITAFESDRNSKITGVLGGETVLNNTDPNGESPYNNGAYKPTGKFGYFTNDSTRIGPVITGLTVTLADASIKAAINNVTATILVSDPEMIKSIEETFFRPGQLLEFEIIQNEEAILSDRPDLNQDESLFTTRILKQQYEETEDEFDISSYFEMNKFIFLGIVDGFKVEYKDDASLEVTITSRAAASVFTDVSLFVSNSDVPNASIDEKITEKFSDKIKNNIERYIKGKVEIDTGKITPFIERYQILKNTPFKDDRVLLHAPLYKNRDGTVYEETTMISLGLLVDFIEEILYNNTKNRADSAVQNVTTEKENLVIPNMRIQCNDELCKTNYYEYLTSADPKRILLYQGEGNESNSNSYPAQRASLNEGYSVTDSGLRIADSIDTLSQPMEQDDLEDYILQYYSSAENKDSVPGFYEMSPAEEGSDALQKHGCLSRILINLEVIEQFEDELLNDPEAAFTVKNFVRMINREINKQTGGAINPGVIFHPELPNILVLYDQNYLGADQVIEEFEIPAFSSKDEGTVVRELKMSYDLPEKDRALLFGFQSQNVSVDKTASFNPYLIGGPEEKQKREEEWKEQHEIAVKQLAEAKANLTTDPKKLSNTQKLQIALQKYIKYSKPKLTESLDQQKPRWLYSLDFTIDGVNGFRFGDVFQFRGVPVQNSDNYVFTITKIVHTVSATGEWTTAISTQSRAKSYTIF